MFRITFLGTGGGRHTTMYQTRCTGGMLIEHGDPAKRLHVDPGPGALTQMARIHYDLGTTDSVIISHAHPDHYSDGPSVIEGMTHGGWVKRGHIYGSPSVISGAAGLGPTLSKYHLGLAEGYSSFVPGDTLDVDGMKVDICRARHSDPTNVGFRFHTENGIVSYLSDTEYDEEIGRQYMGSRVLILPVTTPHDNKIPWHMCTDTAAEICALVRPELAVFIHLGIVMIEEDPEKEAAICQERSGVRTVAGRDLMTLDVGENISLGERRAYDGREPFIPSWAPTRQRLV
ncbi:MAG: metal-dependent hydrolase [Methanomethylophilus alvi]|nr:MAG: metal-dependent hydrolase [Methanomethylophilus alvi]WII09968.1 MBL fold metallo-hydrolase [Methanomassiliicoccales archaeon LGM-DZ1]